ncbi:hypothetical protein [Naasia sp. SYSU D00057]|uniref:hypothetical protein n=1 Tax=Naasia sp. SYSU D00057 TaxID=2817380 RepID=UPI001FEE6C22|nr:hypothetical protein [Naasia sp. SYSU D00057]
MALFLRGRRKGIAVAGTVVSGIALVLSIAMGLFYTAAFVASVDQAVEDRAPSVVEPEDQAAGAPADDTAPPAEQVDEATAGSRENPSALGTTISVEGGDGVDWEITPTSALLDVTAQVKAANTFNPDPAPGNVYAQLNVHVKYVGPDSGSPSELVFTYVSDEGREYNGSFVVMDGQLSDVSELFSPGEADGSVIIEIPADGADQGVWGVEYVWGDPHFFAAV